MQCYSLEESIDEITLLVADEIRETLPAWTVNGISPLENIGDQIPVANYSYAQAGRLYESFRRPKRRARAEMGDQAEGGAPHPRPTVTDGIELRVTGHEDPDHWQQQHGDEYDGEQHLAGHRDYGADAYDHRARRYDRGEDQNEPHQLQKGPYPEDDGFYEEQGAKPKRSPQYDAHGHMYPEVKVNSSKAQSPRGDYHVPSAPPMDSRNPYTNVPPQQQNPSPYANAPPKTREVDPYARPSPPTQDSREYAPLRDQFTRLRMQGSDRSSHSDVADSGICSDSDGHVREGSYDKPFNPGMKKHSPTHPYAMDNHGFHNDEAIVSEAMRKHKELIAKMVGGAQLQAAEEDDYDRDNGGYYAGRNSALPSPYSKSGVPSPNSLNGYASAGHPHYGQNTQSSMQQVDESFI